MKEKTARRQPKPKKTGITVGKVIKGFFLTIFRLFATFIMVGTITGCIVACVLTVYILQYIGADEQIQLESYKLGYTSIMYAGHPDDYPDGDPPELSRLYFVDNNRIWVNLDQITDYTKQAMIAIEDKRFEEHAGVDWRRTVGGFVGLFIPLSDTTAGGGSTIPQQLIKNITNDKEYRVDRKVREIFRALDLSRRYSKDQILETYLNVIPFGNGTNGIQSAANTYFGKDAWDLTLAESAAIVGITQKPGAYNPFLYPEANQTRREWVLFEMLDQERITQEEYDQAMAEKLVFKSTEYYDTIEQIQSYYVDHVMEDVIEGLMDKFDWSYSYAQEQLFQGGYKVYAAVDQDIQNIVEEYYSTEDNFPAIYNSDYPQSACVIMEPNGRIVAMVGSIGDKEGNRMFNRATMAKRQPGSSLKPLGPYSLAMEYNYINWSTIVEDSPITLQEPGKADRLWPVNYTHVYSGNVTVQYAIQWSLNTVPAKLVQQLTPRVVFDFLHDDLNMTSLVDSSTSGDVNLAPLTLGALTHGVTPLEMAAGYQMFVNGGYYVKPYSYYMVKDSTGRTVLEPDSLPRSVISEDTSVVMNRLLQRVVSGGTGTPANLVSMPTGGKTGTSDEDVDQWFIGFTPYYVCQVWLGYDTPQYYDDNGILRTNTIRYGTYPPPVVFNRIMSTIHEDLEYQSFLDSDQVVSLQYCTATGKLASTNCPSVASGWYRKSRFPETCNGIHVVEDPEKPDDPEDNPEEETSGETSQPSIPVPTPNARTPDGIDT